MRNHLIRCILLGAHIGLCGDAHAGGQQEKPLPANLCAEFLTEKKSSEPKQDTVNPNTVGEEAFKLGLDYQLGKNGKVKDLAKAKAEYERSARSGHQDGIYAYAALLLRMAQTNSEAAEAYVLFDKLATAGHPGGIGMMALAYKSGAPGVKPNLENYKSYVERAAWLGEIAPQIEYLALLNKRSYRTETDERKKRCLESMLR